MPHLVDAFFFGLVNKLGHATAGGMGGGTAQVFVGHFFAGYRLDDVWASDIHLAGSLDHKYEVGDGRGVDRAASRRANNHGYLGDDARVHGVAQEDITVGCQASDTLLNAGTA